MHIPDGFLSPPVWAALNVASVPAIAVAARRAGQSREEHRVPLYGVLGAFVFAAQMINFPVAAGTSAHLLGGALLACTIGPAAGVIVMTAVLAIQAFVFQDGGVLALGANVFNLAVVGVLAAYLPYHLFGRGRFRYLAVFAGGALSVLASGCLALAELMGSGVPVQRPVIAVSLVFFLVNAAVEGGVTVAVVKALERMNPGWVQQPGAAGNRALGVLVVTSAILAVAGFLIASGAPDSLEAIAERTGIAGSELTLLPAPFADYRVAGFRAEWIAKAAAGMVGLCLVYMTSVLFARVLVRRRS